MASSLSPTETPHSESKTSVGLDSDETQHNQQEFADEETEQQNQKDAGPAPQDGNFRACIRVLGAFLILANTMGLQSSFGVFQAYYEHRLLSTYSSSVISWIGTVQIFCSASGGIISGPLFDRGYDKITVILGCFLAVLGYMMTSLSTEYYQIFLAQGIAGGLAGTFVFAPCVALTAVSFDRMRSFAVGIATSGFVFGAVIYPIVFRELQPRIGFPWTTRIMAFIALGCFLIAYPLVYWKTPRAKVKSRRILDLAAWKEPAYAIYCWAVFFMYAGYWPPYFYIALYASEAIGTSVSLAFYIFAISNAANVIARWTATLIADRFGIIEVLTSSALASTIIAFCWAAVSSSAGIIVWAIFWGYFSGVMSALFAAVVPNLCPDASVVGTRLGMLNGLWGIAGLVSAPIGGALISAQGGHFSKKDDYLGMQMWVASCLAIATLLFVYPLVHLRRERRKKDKFGS